MSPANENIRPIDRKGNPLSWMLTEDEIEYIKSQKNNGWESYT
jgi:hypothetical protein